MVLVTGLEPVRYCYRGIQQLTLKFCYVILLVLQQHNYLMTASRIFINIFSKGVDIKSEQTDNL